MRGIVERQGEEKVSLTCEINGYRRQLLALNGGNKEMQIIREKLNCIQGEEYK